MPHVAGLKQEAPEKEDAQDQDEHDDDDFDQAHNRFLDELGMVNAMKPKAS
jgi:hypothetical protein